jgi:hypothetical protein
MFSHFRLFGIEPNLHRRGLQRTNLHSTNIRHQLRTHCLSPVHILLLTLRKHLTGYGDIGSFTALLPVFTTGSIGLFATGRGPLLLFSFRCLLYFSQRDLRQFSFLPVSADRTHHFFSNASVYGQTDMIFAASGLEYIRVASLVSCFDTEGSGLRLAELTVLPVEAVSVAEVDGFGSREKTVGESEWATVD